MKCLLQKDADRFLEALKKGEINPAKLTDMTSAERNSFFSKYVGEENAKFVNTQFESKLLLKNQKLGMINWAKSISGINERKRSDLITKIDKLDKALDATSEKTFLADIVEQRLGVKLDIEDARIISDLTSKMKSSFATRFDSKRSDYFKYKQELLKYIRDNSPDIEPTTALGKAGWILSNAASVQRAIKTGFDLSAPLRQGASYFGRKQWNNAFIRMFDYAKKKTAIDELEIDMISHKYSDFAMDVKKDLGLTLLGENLTQREEAFASKMVDKIPLLAGSSRAYAGFLNDLRFNRFVDILEQLDASGNGITENKQAMKDLAQVIAAATGRGNLGSLEVGNTASALATVLFAPRLYVGRIQTVLNPLLKKGQARTEAAKSLATLAGMAVVLIGLTKLAGGDTEDDPTGGEFGKIKIGNTRFDASFGMGPYITFMARQIMSRTKNSSTGITNDLNTGEFGSRDRLDLLFDFLGNRTSPIASIIRDYTRGRTFDGKPLNFETSPRNHFQYIADALMTPLLAKDAVEAFLQASGQESAPLGAAAAGASIFGIGVNTYSQDTDWENSSGKELSQFRDKLGEDKLLEANAIFNQRVNERLSTLVDNKIYQDLSNEDKKRFVTKEKSEIKKDIFKEYNFKYKQEKQSALPKIR